MSLRRLVLTAASMGLVAVGLAELTPPMGQMTDALTAAQRTADTVGADSLVIAATGLLAWAVWVWGALGLALTAASALPGLVGSTARLATHAVLPAAARRSAALLLGLGLGVAAPMATAATVLGTPAVAAVPASGVPDWPTASVPAAPPADRVPDWPGAEVPEVVAHVVVRGDCLWHITSDRLLAQRGRPPTDGETAAATQAWWQANAEVIGPDPDLLLPGQVLSPPDPS